METITNHAPGAFCWPELATTDPEGAKKFYGSLFGWAFQDNPMGPDEVYTIGQLGGRDAAALFKLRPEMLKGGVPPHWAAYIAVSSADDVAEKAKQIGGTAVMEPFDVMEHGRMAVLKDTVGGVFCVWQAKKNMGIGVAGEPGSLAWTQLNTFDQEPAKKFYSSLFGYTTQDDPMQQGGMYTSLLLGGRPVGGIMPMPPGVPQGTPSHWLTYFASANVDATVTKANSTGGTTIVPAQDIPGMGRFAVLQDPQGAVFAIVKFQA